VAPRRTSPRRAVARVVPLPRGIGASPTFALLVPSGRALLVALALVLTGAGLYTGARATSAFEVREFEVRGASPATAGQARAALAPFAGRSLLALDGAEVVRRLERIPEVASAEYDRAFPHTLVVFVREERPVAVLRRGADAWLVAASSRVLRPVARGARPPLPRVWVPKREPVTLGRRVGDATAAGAIAAVARITAGFPARVRDVRATEDELTFQLGSGIELRVGDRSDLVLKLAIAARILPTLATSESGATTYLDVSVVERPVAGGTLNSEVELEG
jgi:cell division septal protein FtsQ